MSLLSEFPAHTYEQWHAAAEALLKGASFEQKLVSKTYEDITIQPIYRREDIAGLEHRKHFPGSASLVRGSQPDGFLKTGWEVSQELAATTPTELNALIHEGLNGGQSELNILFTHGLKIDSAEDVKTALSGVALDAISIWWQSGPASPALAPLVLAAAREMGTSPDKLRGGFQNDPFAESIHQTSCLSIACRFDEAANLTKILSATALRTLCLTGDIYHNAGSTTTQELGYVIASLVTSIEEMKARGISPEATLAKTRIRLSVGSDYFMEIAKIRAARWLWSKVATAYRVENAPVHIHASTSQWNKTTYDAHTNMLRVTSEAFAAVVAGADSLHIGPFDEISGKTDEFSRRIARNLHTILREECGLDRVIDPAGGSNYIEWLTDRIAAKSWAIFQDIEKQGGMLAALESGTVQQAVQSIAKSRFQNIRRRKDKVVGSNMYPDLKGKKLAVHSTHPKASSLPPRRAAEEYEALRDASAVFTSKTGTPPSILQLNIGPSRRYRLRADWTAAFFEAAGFAIDGKRDFKTIEDATAALTESTASIAVITSDDATYLETAEPLARTVKAAKPTIHLLLAGAPGDNESAWRAAGIDDFVNVRSNNYELNEQLLKIAGAL
jgi:methylmalonyl-CoA mutase